MEGKCQSVSDLLKGSVRISAMTLELAVRILS